MKPQIDETIRIREAILATYKSMSCKMAGKWDHSLGLKDKMTGWGVVSADRCKKGISRRIRIQRKK